MPLGPLTRRYLRYHINEIRHAASERFALQSEVILYAAHIGPVLLPPK